jgi:hypothetical protein
MVTTSLPITDATGATQERTALPLTRTVQLPHKALPQLYFVPVNPSFSRITHKRGMSTGTSKSYLFPLTLNEIMNSPLVFSAKSVGLASFD